MNGTAAALAMPGAPPRGGNRTFFAQERVSGCWVVRIGFLVGLRHEVRKFKVPSARKPVNRAGPLSRPKALKERDFSVQSLDGPSAGR